METWKHSSMIVAAIAMLSGATGQAQAPQRRAPGARADNTVAVAVALKAGNDSYASSGKGTCTHAPVASIYDLRAEQWRVEQSDGPRSTTLTLWHPAAGADMFTLTVTSGASRHSVDTVKVNGRGSAQGSGTAALAREGGGGTFTVNAKAADGAPITGTIKCSAFTAAMAEGGD